MGNLLAVLVVFFFWVAVFATMVTLVRASARNHDEEEVVCQLGEEYYAQPSRRAASEMRVAHG